MFRLDAAVQSYAWGSPTAIPEFVGSDPTGDPVAELWFGTHPLGASEAITDEGPQPLVDLIGDLSFMLKVLAPDQPLSIQVHPSSTVAAAGFAAEEAAGRDVADPTRDYRDPHHKPEMVYALTPFETLVGFRAMDDIVRLLQPLDVPLAQGLLARSGAGVKSMVEHLLAAPASSVDVDDFVSACDAELASGRDVARGYLTVIEAAAVHPSDPGLALALLMNRLTLKPGDAAFIGPGLIHAHLSGLCLEVMASSDNVFRAGLTPKRVNPHGVLESLETDGDVDPLVSPERVGQATHVFAPSGDLFALSVTEGAEDRLPGAGSRILLCLDGDVDIRSAAGERIALTRGQAAFAASADGALSVRGQGTTAQAYVP